MVGRIRTIDHLPHAEECDEVDTNPSSVRIETLDLKESNHFETRLDVNRDEKNGSFNSREYMYTCSELFVADNGKSLKGLRGQSDIFPCQREHISMSVVAWF